MVNTEAAASGIRDRWRAQFVGWVRTWRGLFVPPPTPNFFKYQLSLVPQRGGQTSCIHHPTTLLPPGPMQAVWIPFVVLCRIRFSTPPYFWSGSPRYLGALCFPYNCVGILGSTARIVFIIWLITIYATFYPHHLTPAPDVNAIQQIWLYNMGIWRMDINVVIVHQDVSASIFLSKF